MTDAKQTGSKPQEGTPRKRPPFAPVLRDLPAEQAGAAVDWSPWYVDDEEHVAESCEQGEIIRELVSTLKELARVRGWERLYVGADNYFAWLPDHPQVRVSPDVYLVDNPPAPLPRSWQTWRPGHRPPRWALEVVSEDWSKDYQDGPAKYALLGCTELVLFDPEATRGPTGGGRRVPLSVFRRGEDGALAAVYAGAGPAYCEQLGCWLQPHREGYRVRLRLSEDKDGQRPLMTRAESEAARAKAAEEARAKAEERVRELEERLAASKPDRD